MTGMWFDGNNVLETLVNHFLPCALGNTKQTLQQYLVPSVIVFYSTEISLMALEI